jgi:hypothetical protein
MQMDHHSLPVLLSPGVPTLSLSRRASRSAPRSPEEIANEKSVVPSAADRSPHRSPGNPRPPRPLTGLPRCRHLRSFRRARRGRDPRCQNWPGHRVPRGGTHRRGGVCAPARADRFPDRYHTKGDGDTCPSSIGCLRPGRNAGLSSRSHTSRHELILARLCGPRDGRDQRPAWTRPMIPPGETGEGAASTAAERPHRRGGVSMTGEIGAGEAANDPHGERLCRARTSTLRS